jgi:hypothetical protein
MKTLSIAEVAGALGVSRHAVVQRLKTGKLKGIRVTNADGQGEWRVCSDRAIRQAVASKRGVLPDDAIFSFDPEIAEAVEAESITERGSVDCQTAEAGRLHMVAEMLMKPLLEKLEAQAIALRAKDLIIEEQGRQLKLLPDLQKSAEQERKAAELRALEVEALKKQIQALEEQIARGETPDVRQLRQVKAAKEAELARLASGVMTRERRILTLEEKLASAEEHTSLIQETQSRLLQKVQEERKRAQEAAAELAQLKRSHEEKDLREWELTVLATELERQKSSQEEQIKRLEHDLRAAEDFRVRVKDAQEKLLQKAADERKRAEEALSALEELRQQESETPNASGSEACHTPAQPKSIWQKLWSWGS